MEFWTRLFKQLETSQIVSNVELFSVWVESYTTPDNHQAMGLDSTMTDINNTVSHIFTSYSGPSIHTIPNDHTLVLPQTKGHSFGQSHLDENHLKPKYVSHGKFQSSFEAKKHGESGLKYAKSFSANCLLWTWLLFCLLSCEQVSPWKATIS